MGPKRKKGFVVLTPAQKEKLRAALGNPALVSYAQIAEHSGVSRATVIKHARETGYRPRGNFVQTRAVKQPKINARLIERARKMAQFVRDEAAHKRGVSANDLMKRYGGTKKAAVELLKRLEEAGVPVIRRTQSDQGVRKRGGASLTQVINGK